MVMVKKVLVMLIVSAAVRCYDWDGAVGDDCDSNDCVGVGGGGDDG